MGTTGRGSHAGGPHAFDSNPGVAEPFERRIAWQSEVLPSSDGSGSGAPTHRGRGCLQRPHNLCGGSNSRHTCFPTASREKASVRGFPVPRTREEDGIGARPSLSDNRGHDGRSTPQATVGFRPRRSGTKRTRWSASRPPSRSAPSGSTTTISGRPKTMTWNDCSGRRGRNRSDRRRPTRRPNDSRGSAVAAWEVAGWRRGCVSIGPGICVRHRARHRASVCGVASGVRDSTPRA